MFNISYNEWKKRFSNDDDARLSKYRKLFEIRIGNFTLGEGLEEIIYFINFTFNDFNTRSENKLIVLSKDNKKDYITIREEIVSLILCEDPCLTIGENIRRMVG